MQLQLLSNASLLSTMISAAQNSCSQLVNFSVGSVLRAIFQANASVALWLQWLTSQVLLTTRAATSTGSDLDSWVADYGLNRLPAVEATGSVTLFRNDVGSAMIVSPGGLVRTGDGSSQFVIVADAGNAAWNIEAAGYAMPSGQNSITVPVVAMLAGVAGNVQPGAISLLASALPGIDGVYNPLALTGGLDAESDAALRLRASHYFASLSKATTTAVTAAASSVQQGLTVLVLENEPVFGQFVVMVDDGSGYPPSALLQAIYAAVDLVRPLGTSFAVRPPSVLPVSVAVTLVTATGANHAAITAQVAVAVTAMINALPIGATLPVTRVAATAYNVSPNILNVTVLLNGGAIDLVPGAGSVIRAAAMVVG